VPALGPVVVFAAAALEVAAVMGDVSSAACLGIPLLFGAVSYAIAGLPLLRSLALPLVLLAMMVPPPRFFTAEILFRLKLLVTKAAVFLLQAGGEIVTSEGNQILVPGQTLFVADACSGLTSIVTLLPLAFIVAYFLSRGIWRRALVVASVVPLALAANVLRVIVTVQLVSSQGVEFAQGLLHESFGTATFVLGTLAVIGVARILR
jgi:exosortase